MKAVYTIKPSPYYNILLPTRFEEIELQEKGSYKKKVVPFYKRQTNFFLPLILPTKQAHLWDFFRDQFEIKSNFSGKLLFNMNDQFWEDLLPGLNITPKLKTKYRKEISDMELNPAFKGSIRTHENNTFEVYFE